MCIKGLTQPSSPTTGPASNLPDPPAADPGITAHPGAALSHPAIAAMTSGLRLNGAQARTGGEVIDQR